MFKVLANSTLNTNLLRSDPLTADDDGVLMVGSGYVGCLKEGPNIVLSDRSAKVIFQNVEFGKCPITLCKFLDSDSTHVFSLLYVRFGSSLTQLRGFKNSLVLDKL